MKQPIAFTLLLLFSMTCYSQAPRYNPDDSLYHTKRGKIFSGAVTYAMDTIYGAVMDKTTTIYSNGKITLSESFYPSGTLKSQFKANNDTTAYSSYFNNGQLKSKNQKVNKKPFGSDTKWYKNGMISDLKIYRDDTVTCKGTHKNGMRSYQYKKVKGEFYGDNLSWYADGGIAHQQTNMSIPNRKQEDRTFYRNGILHKQILLLDDLLKNKRTKIYYTKNGVLLKEEYWEGDTIIKRKIYNTEVECISNNESLSPDINHSYQELLKVR